MNCQWHRGDGDVKRSGLLDLGADGSVVHTADFIKWQLGIYLYDINDVVVYHDPV